MSRGPERLAAYLAQRRRMGEPGIVPVGFEPSELTAFLRSKVVDAAKSSTSRRPLDPDGGAPVKPRDVSGSAGERQTQHAPDAVAPDYDGLRQQALSCTRCRLSEGRRHVVFSDGNPSGRLMVVGEAPGAREDATGIPFVGQAGMLLDLILAAVDLSRRDSVYICNVLKCRPPGNRNPLPDEIESCAPLLKRQIELVAPEVLLAAGSFAAQWLTRTKRPLGKLRGKVYSYQGVPLVVTYHPAALLRNPGWNRLCWDDLQLLRQVMDGA